VFLDFLLLFRIIREWKLVVALGIAFGNTGYPRSGSRTVSHHYLSGIGLRGIGEHEGIGYISVKDFDVKIDLGLQKHFWNGLTGQTIIPSLTVPPYYQ
jgi:hypothetical protein